MNPIPGDADAQHARLLNHPAAPKLSNPTADAVEQLNGYWAGIFKHVDMLEAVHQYFPDYMPAFSLISL